MISVVITNLNNYHELWFTIQSVISTLKGYKYEIIIADNGSEDSDLTQTRNMVNVMSDEHDIKLVIWGRIKSCPGIRTAGAIEAKYDLICFMDGHVVLEKNYFDSVVPLFDDPDVYIVFVPEIYFSEMLYEYTMNHQINFQQSTTTFNPISDKPYPVVAACQACTMIRKDYLKFFFPKDELSYIPYTMDEPNTPLLAWMFGKKVLIDPRTYYAHRPWAYTPGGDAGYETWRPLGAYALGGQEWYEKSMKFWHSEVKADLPRKHRDFIEKNAKVKFKDIKEYLINQGITR